MVVVEDGRAVCVTYLLLGPLPFGTMLTVRTILSPYFDITNIYCSDSFVHRENAYLVSMKNSLERLDIASA